jgi:tetratricopeptide (TPR) repeat protein
MSNEKLNLVRELIRTEKANEAKSVFYGIAADDTVEYFLIKGKLEQKFQNWGKAINAYSKVIELDPDNIEALNNLQLIQNILNFWNPEMFNP